MTAVARDPLDEALGRYHAARTVLEQEQARCDMDVIAMLRESWRRVRSAAVARDPWILERLAVLREELSRDY